MSFLGQLNQLDGLQMRAIINLILKVQRTYRRRPPIMWIFYKSHNRNNK